MKINEKHILEARELNLDIIKKIDNDSYIYRLPCTHEQKLFYGNVRKKLFKCDACFREKHINAAKEANLDLITPYNDISGKYNSYRFKDCGHIRDIDATCVLNRTFSCLSCYTDKLKVKSHDLNIEILTLKSKRCYKYVKFLCCGKIYQAQLSSIQNKTLRCNDCFFLKKKEELRQKVLKFNLILLDKEDKKDYWSFKLPCGHTKVMQAEAAKKNSYKCNICFTASRSFPGFVYLLKITNGTEKFLKLGFSKNVGFRIKQYKINKNYSIEVIKVKNFTDGYTAEKFERLLHKKYTNYKLNTDYTKQILENGYNECYIFSIKNVLIKELG